MVTIMDRPIILTDFNNEVLNRQDADLFDNSPITYRRDNADTNTNAIVSPW